MTVRIYLLLLLQKKKRKVPFIGGGTVRQINNKNLVSGNFQGLRSLV